MPVPVSRQLMREARDPQGERLAVDRAAFVRRMPVALGTVVLATALALVGAPAAEALGLL